MAWSNRNLFSEATELAGLSAMRTEQNSVELFHLVLKATPAPSFYRLSVYGMHPSDCR